MVDSLNFVIKGINPTAKQVYDYISQNSYDDKYWFFKKMITLEQGKPMPVSFGDSLKQFIPFGEANASMPNVSPDFGFGLSQLTNPRPFATEIWNWKENVDAAYKLLKNTKEKEMRRHYSNLIKYIKDYKINNPDSTIVFHIDTLIGGVTWTHELGDIFSDEGTWKKYIPKITTAGKHSFLDASLMKYYNGNGVSTDHYFYYLSKHGKTTGSPAPEWRIDDNAHYGTSVNYYVRDVSKTNIKLH